MSLPQVLGCRPPPSHLTCPHPVVRVSIFLMTLCGNSVDKNRVSGDNVGSSEGSRNFAWLIRSQNQRKAP